MKRTLLTLLLIAAMLLVLTACGGQNTADDSTAAGESYEVLDTGSGEESGKTTEKKSDKKDKEQKETEQETEKTAETATPQESSAAKQSTAPAAGGATGEKDGTVSASKYNAIQLGMTYDEVKNIMGGDGEKVSTSELEGNQYETYQWLTSDGSGNAAIALKNGKVTTKMQMNVSWTDPVATKAIYEKIKEGMTYEEVKKLLGCDGAVTYMDADEEYGYQYTEYMWSGENSTFIQIVFENNKVVMMNQSGL